MDIRLGQSYSFSQLGQRGNQEDSRYPDCDISDERQRFFVVCDGVGGNAKGEVASKTVCESIGKSLAEKDLSNLVFDNRMFSVVLDAAYDALDNASDSSNEGMATTLTFVCFHKGGCTMAHIGDSRIYHIRPDKGILYRSDDHSLVNSMVHSGLISPEDAVNHPQSNIITRCMESVAADQNRAMATVTVTTDIEAGDYFFLCSDGVLHCISDEILVEILSKKTNNEDKMLIIATDCCESSDNNTAILIPILEVCKENKIYTNDIKEENSNITLRMDAKQQVSTEVVSIQKVKHQNGIFQKVKRLFFPK